MTPAAKAKVIDAYLKLRDAQEAIAQAEVAISGSIAPDSPERDADYMLWTLVLTAQKELQGFMPPFGITHTLYYAAAFCGYKEK